MKKSVSPKAAIKKLYMKIKKAAKELESMLLKLEELRMQDKKAAKPAKAKKVKKAKKAAKKVPKKAKKKVARRKAK